MAAAIEVVRKYHDAFNSHSGGWKDLVDDNVVFVGPLQKASGKQELVSLNEQFLQLHKGTRLLKRFEAGSDVCSISEYVLNTPSGKPLTCTVAEWATVRDGRIANFRIYYDPREFAKSFGMT